MTDRRAYQYVSLTAAIEDKSSPLRAYLDRRFPNVKPVRSVYQTPGGPLLVEGGPANPGTIGAAFDFTVRMVVDPTDNMTLALRGFSHSREQLAIMRQVVDVAQQAADCRDRDAPEELLRASWAFALSVEVYRLGMVPPGSPLATVISRGTFTPSDLLGIATADALRELGRLHTLACDRLYPNLPLTAARIAIGPLFDGSTLCAADADLIIDGLLLEIKTRQGTKSKTLGRRVDTLSLADIYQILGYVLFDHSNTHAINSVGYYSGRYGNLTRWPLQEFLDSLAGQAVDVTQEREQVWNLLSVAYRPYDWPTPT